MATLTSLFALGLFGCGSSGSSGSSGGGTTAVVSTGYSYNTYGQCVQTSTGQIVTSTYCTTANTGYSYNTSGQCIQTSTGQIVTTAYCQTGYATTGYGTTGYGTTYGQCVGYYYYNGQLSYCNGYNCRGYTLISAQTGQQVTCQ